MAALSALLHEKIFATVAMIDVYEQFYWIRYYTHSKTSQVGKQSDTAGTGERGCNMAHNVIPRDIIQSLQRITELRYMRMRMKNFRYEFMNLLQVLQTDFLSNH